MKTKNFLQKGFTTGSALILTVVITTLLAILGIMFLMSSRIDKMSTSSIQDNMELNAAVDAVIGRISHNLIDDLDSNPDIGSYYDYPDVNNRWLANLEPYEDVNGEYKWRQITNLWNGLSYAGSRDVNTDIIPDYQNNILSGMLADADGDGVSDSRWIQIRDMNSSKGNPFYTAVRVIDNGGMLNINTAYKFDPCSMERKRVDGSSQTQINLTKLAMRGSNGTFDQAADTLMAWRCSSAPNDVSSYERDVIRQDEPKRPYTPFDISDELEMRSRFLVNNEDIDTRMEEVWDNVFQIGKQSPFEGSLADWPQRATLDLQNPDPNIYSYRHLATVYNMDRVIDINGNEMAYINNIKEPNISPSNKLYMNFLRCIDRDLIDPARISTLKSEFAQIAVNIKDYADSDNVVSILDTKDTTIGSNGLFYGFETPCIYISELTYAYKKANRNIPGDTDHVAFGIELIKLYGDDKFGDEFRLFIHGPTDSNVTINGSSFSTRGSKFYVKLYESDVNNGLLGPRVIFGDTPESGAQGVDPRVKLSWDKSWQNESQYDIYIGKVSTTDPCFNQVKVQIEDNVKKATSTNGLGVYRERLTGPSYDPAGEFDKSTLYYWRIDDLDAAGNVLSKGEVMNFTTADKIPTADTNSIGFTDTVFTGGTLIELRRYYDVNDYIVVDSVIVEPNLVTKIIDVPAGKSYTRDIREYLCIKKLWGYSVPGNPSASTPSLGYSSRHYQNQDPNMKPIQSQPRSFDNVGDVYKVFRVNAYTFFKQNSNEIERNCLIDLTEPNVQRIFNYITALKDQLIENTNKVKGRININTAPWYVIAQLPWVRPELARAIVAYRDKQDLTSEGGPDYRSRGRSGGIDSSYVLGDPPMVREKPGFESIGELTTVVNYDDNSTEPGYYYSMRRYGKDKDATGQPLDQPSFPDLTFNQRKRIGDGAPNDQEELNLIFARISDLVTVRSDLFTAYILVRLGENGPQKRVIAILDRSDKGNVKIIARYPVPDPR